MKQQLRIILMAVIIIDMPLRQHIFKFSNHQILSLPVHLLVIRQEFLEADICQRVLEESLDR